MIAVISHDAGGAEILSSYVRRMEIDCICVLDGPACKIFERKVDRVKTGSLEAAVNQCTRVICGTSWNSDIELTAIKLARLSGKPSVAFVDHWVNYRERFIRSGEIILPDEIWVGDVMAKTIAEDVIPNIIVTLVDNPYLRDIREELLLNQPCRSSVSKSSNVLYVCEPISVHALLRHGDARFWGYSEDDALRYFLSNISAIGKPIDQIVIRPHPSESFDKYAWIRNEFELPIALGGARTLLEEIRDSDIVVGCESMALVVALHAGKNVISCIPPHGRPCTLPYPDIISMQSILDRRR